MKFFDTNILIYAFSKNVDNSEQQKISINLIENAILNNNLVLSELILSEFAFISNKLQEESINIENNLKFLSQYVLSVNNSIERFIKILEKTKLYKSSFDIQHLIFCEKHNCKLFTFDKGFKKLKDIAKTEIIIL